MSNRRWDYDLLEREYVSSDVSLRKLAERHGISTHSLITAQSKKRDWVRKREEFRLRAADQSVIFMADKEADIRAKEMVIRQNAVEAIDEAITKLRSDMKRTRRVLDGDQYVDEPVMIFRPADIVSLIDRFQVLFGRPSTITEERNLGIQLEGGVSADVLQQFVDATRGLGAPGGASESPIPRSDRARENGGA